MSFQLCFDFDNTLTSFDVLDEVISRFAVDNRWKAYEEAWKSGRIGSRECLKQQLKSVRVKREKLSTYLASVKIDPAFVKICAWLKERGMQPAILSDSFSFFIDSILRANGFTGIKVYSNRLTIRGDRLIPSFPFANSDCDTCGHCKKDNIFNNGLETHGKKIIYVGDGQSDICPAEHSDIVFAKGKLLDYLRSKNKPCYEFKDLSRVYEFLQGELR